MDGVLVREEHALPAAILVLSGSTSLDEAEKYPFRPSRILQSIADAIELI